MVIHHWKKTDWMDVELLSRKIETGIGYFFLLLKMLAAFCGLAQLGIAVSELRPHRPAGGNGMRLGLEEGVRGDGSRSLTEPPSFFHFCAGHVAGRQDRQTVDSQFLSGFVRTDLVAFFFFFFLVVVVVAFFYIHT
ncbi:hypothetical protein QBC43DRAFT_85700 [Cladorrhinum sp. PSN259]|nr:hypothetical protein QBC43DRAFT_85700 [Cladorrhinum sp. PSN259]